METITKQQQNLCFRAVTIADLDRIVQLYQEQKTTLDSALTTQFGLPFYVAEWNNQIIGYSYATVTISNEYSLKTNIDTTFYKYPFNENLMQESALFFEKEWKNTSNKNLAVAIAQLVNWLNNSNS